MNILHINKVPKPNVINQMSKAVTNGQSHKNASSWECLILSDINGDIAML